MCARSAVKPSYNIYVGYGRTDFDAVDGIHDCMFRYASLVYIVHGGLSGCFSKGTHQSSSEHVDLPLRKVKKCYGIGL